MPWNDNASKPSIAVKTWHPSKNEETGEWNDLDYFELSFDDGYQLFNLADDPAEKTDLASKMPEKVNELKALLEKYRNSGRSTD